MQRRRGAVRLLLLLVAGYGISSFVLPGRVSTGVASYALAPAFWLLVVLFVRRLPPVTPAGSPQLRSELLLLSGMIGGFHVFCLFMGGVFSGFGKSPYSFAATALVLNLWSVAAALVGMEISRAYVTGAFGRKWPVLTIALVTVLFALIELRPAGLMGMHDLRSVVTVMGENVVPVFAISALASLLAYLGGPKPAMVYRGVVLSFHWLSPILPDLTWGLIALVGVFAPAIGYAAVESLAAGRIRTVPRVRVSGESSSPAGWLTASVVLLGMFWFSLGLLPVFPATIITGSMSPAYLRGDVALATKTDGADIERGDVIIYAAGTLPIIHRVVDVREEDGTTVFITKGDDNPDADVLPVRPEQVKGRVIGRIPKVGHITLFLRSEDAAVVDSESGGT